MWNVVTVEALPPNNIPLGLVVTQSEVTVVLFPSNEVK